MFEYKEISNAFCFLKIWKGSNLLKRVGIFGGTFNPIHKGHINLALNIVKNIRLDKVLVIPNNMPPHKKESHLLDGEIRYEMCRLACQEYPRLVVDDIEITQQGKNYTVNTLKRIARREENSKLYLIVGSDKFMKISKWVGFKEIMKLATICTTPRNYGELINLIEMENKLQECGARTKICISNIFPISSSEIRRKISHAQDVSDMLHSKVYEYIKKNNLYKDEKGILEIKCG